MALSLQDKKNIVSEVKQAAKSTLSAVIANFCGISSIEMTNLRKKARKNNVNLYVIKNTLIIKIIKNTQFKSLKKSCKGQSIIAFSNIHPGSAARILKEFSENNKKFKIKGASFKGKFISSSKISYLVNLPTQEEALIKFIWSIKDASTGKLIRSLSSITNIN
ncbi:50S ribosomal protein L10 [Sodalis-like secondary symbiont of Drepanosiphum platanoidis]|uniref:50S ribosomal protein L10 n=1 Tax=Sodalis-like secondary symbiont of Drepanosiphum platanoidis TaxID=2994493 RepID=UPI00346421AB